MFSGSGFVPVSVAPRLCINSMMGLYRRSANLSKFTDSAEHSIWAWLCPVFKAAKNAAAWNCESKFKAKDVRSHKPRGDELMHGLLVLVALLSLSLRLRIVLVAECHVS